MRDLHVVALSEDGQHVVLASCPDADRGEFRVAVDDRLTASLRGELPRPGEAEPRHVTPKEIQARLRDGESVEQIAVSAGLPVAKIERFAGPVLSELARVVDGARAAVLTRPRRGRSALPLGESVDRHLAEAAGHSPESTVWSARREGPGRWVVEVAWTARGRHRRAGWSYDAAAREVQPLDPPSAALGHTDPTEAAGADPSRRLARRPAAADVPTTRPRTRAASSPAPRSRTAAAATAAAKPSRTTQAAKPPAKTSRTARAAAATATTGAAAPKAPAAGPARTPTAERKAPVRRPPAPKPATRQAPAEPATARRTAAPSTPAQGADAHKARVRPAAAAGTSALDAPAVKRTAQAPAVERTVAKAPGVKRSAAKAPAAERAATKQPAAAAARVKTPAAAARRTRTAAGDPRRDEAAVASTAAVPAPVQPGGKPLLRVVRPLDDHDHDRSPSRGAAPARTGERSTTEPPAAGAPAAAPPPAAAAPLPAETAPVWRAAGQRASVPDWADVLFGTAPARRPSDGGQPDRSS